VNEAQFKVILLALLLVDDGIRLYYLKGYKKFERVTVKYKRREKFLSYLVGLGLIPIIFYIFTSWIDIFHLPLPPGVRWLGAVFIFAGDLLFIWSHKALGRNWSPILEIRKEHVLVTDGPYRFIRHPMYAAIFLIGIGVSLLSANWIVALSYMLPTTCLYLVRVSDEEEMMIGQFGDDYRKYMARTGRLVPKLSIPGVNLKI